MKLEGHRECTRIAVREFLAGYPRTTSGWPENHLRSQTHHMHGSVTFELDYYAQQRDIIDVCTLGHWMNFGQAGHFMRRFDGQSPYQAYVDACDYIKEHALKFAKAAFRGHGSSQLLSLGHACHAVEDSFTPCHAQRVPQGTPTNPGPIFKPLMYAGVEAANHSKIDKQWQIGTTGTLSLWGMQAKNGVRALLQMIFTDVDIARKSQAKEFVHLNGWMNFRETWLKVSPDISKQRDPAYDLIDKYYSGVVMGNMNHALNFDEEGLAKAIYHGLGTNTQAVYAVFDRLNEYHTVDADDVAEIYVDMLRREKPPKISTAVRRNRRLVDLLIRILDEGWTSDNEYKCIAYLKSIKK